MACETAPRILIIEDEPVLAFVLEEVLDEAGFRIAGVATRLARALTLIKAGGCDAALLDTNLAGISAAPIAQALAALRIPFVVLSGYSPQQQEPAFAVAARRLQKPCPPERLVDAIRGIT